jgi:uncharacterized phage protein (TIGR02218 family)
VFGFTDHDAPLDALGMRFEPGAALQAGAVEKSLGLGVDTASAQAALSSDLITEDALARGLWDGAQVELFCVDWAAPDHVVRLFAGTLGEARRHGAAFEAELRGVQAKLQAPFGRVYSAQCDAAVGDARCGVDLADPAFRADGVVLAVISERAFRADGLSGFADGWFTYGRLRWADGGGADVAVHRASADTATLELAAPSRAPITPGAAFVVTAGCARTWTACGVKFANRVNFRGMPHMPGNDVIQTTPAAGDRMDGSSRWTP